MRAVPGWLRAPLLLGLLVLAGRMLPGMAGEAASYPALGVFPGMALALPLGWRWSRSRRLLIGLALAPLASASLGWALMGSGVPLPLAARSIALGGWIAWTALEALRARSHESAPEEGEPVPRLVRAWSLGLAAAVAIPPLVNPFIRVHGDGWVHAGLAWEIAVRGVPPQDPRFAGLPLNYVWFYDLYVALLTGLGGKDPFVLMAILNVIAAALLARLAYRLGWAVWRDRDAAAGASLLLTLGFNAGMYLLWPLHLGTALVGRVRGMEDVRRVIAHSYLLDDRVFFTLSAPFAHPVSFLDKLLLGNPLPYAWVLTLFYLDALLEWVREPRPELLAWAALGASGLLLFHFVPGLSVIPVTLGALALAAVLRRRWPWLPDIRRLAAFGAATLIGALLVLPYTLSITRGWRPSQTGLHERHFHIGTVMLWTLLTSCAVGLAFAWRPLRRLVPERRREGMLLALYLAGMAALALVVHLPEDNEHKLTFQTFVPIAMLGGAAFLPALRGWYRRWGALRANALVAVLFLNVALLLGGYLVDPRAASAPELSRGPGEERLYGWIRDSTAARSIFVDNGFRDYIMVRGQRRLYYGSSFGPERAGFPLPQVIERRAVMADLYGAGADLDRDARSLGALGGPSYVVFRPADPGGEAGWRRLERRPDLFRRVFAQEGFRVYALRAGTG